jgi:hypothetical protein
MKSLSCLMVIIPLVTSFAQITFQKNYGTYLHEQAFSVQQTTDGGYIMAGTKSTGGMNPDIYLVRTDERGDTLWTKTYYRNYSSVARAVLETLGGFMVAGSDVITIGPGRMDFFLMKIDQQGDTVWTRTYGGSNDEQAFDLKPTPDGGYILCGQATELSGQLSYFLVKTNSWGNRLWDQKYGLGERDRAYGKSVQVTSDGGYVIIGYVDDVDVGISADYVYMVKADAAGSVVWTKSFDWPGAELAYDIQEVSDGYAIVGHSNSMGTGGWEIFLLKTDTLGNELWTRTYGDSSDERAYSLEKMPDNGFLISGMTRSMGAGSSDFYLIRTDSLGNTLWTRTYGGTSSEEAWDFKPTADGGYVIGGSSYSYTAGWADFYLVKTDANGYVPIQSGRDPGIVQNYHLYQNYPNPFNPITVISWQLAVGSPVKLTISNIRGQEIVTLVDEIQQAGFHSVRFGASDLASGVYLYRLQAGDFVESRKMLLMR